MGKVGKPGKAKGAGAGAGKAKSTSSGDPATITVYSDGSSSWTPGGKKQPKKRP